MERYTLAADPYRIDFPGLPQGGEGDAGDTKRRSRGRSRPTGLLSYELRWAVVVGFLATLPFVTLVRGSVFFFHRHPVSGWMALGGGALVTFLLLTLYLVLLSFRMGRKGRVPRGFLKAAGVLVGAYCLYALLFLSSANAKTEEIRETYTSLNPILRVAVSTLLLVDRDGILTGTGRKSEDYQSWGLTVNESSLHLPQADGSVYAVDVRTVGRPEWRNRAVSVYFRAMGFQALRHVGTADHLHVSLQPNAASTEVNR